MLFECEHILSISLSTDLISQMWIFRPNLYLSVQHKSNMTDDLRDMMVKQGGQFEFEGPTIIYCPTKKSAEQVEQGVKCKFLDYWTSWAHLCPFTVGSYASLSVCLSATGE